MAYTTFAFKNKAGDYAKTMYANVFTGMSFLLLGACFTVSVFSKEVVSIMADAKYFGAYILIAPLLFSQAAMACNNIVGYGISFTKKSKYFLISSIIAAVINVILNYFLVKYYGAYGASIATMISHIVLFIFTYVVSQRLYRVDYKIVKTAIVFFATFFIATSITEMSIVVKIVVYIITVAVALFIYKEEINNTVKLFRK